MTGTKLPAFADNTDSTTRSDYREHIRTMLELEPRNGNNFVLTELRELAVFVENNGPEPVIEQQLYWVTGPNCKHLFTHGDEQTLCSKMSVPYNQNGERDKGRTYQFNRFDHGLKKWCSICLNELYQLETEGDKQ